MEGENLVLLNIIMGILIFGVLLPLVVAFYLLPSIVARLRHHPSKGAIFDEPVPRMDHSGLDYSLVLRVQQRHQCAPLPSDQCQCQPKRRSL